MKIINPTSIEYIQERNLLLQTELRDTPLPFNISEEYPLVLGKDPSYSFCVIDESNRIIAHANFIEKTVIDKDGTILYKVALIGNVTSRKEFRNKGIIRQLFSYLENKAKKLNILALLLWSNLDKFYPKLGFKKIGNEYLFEIKDKDEGNSNKTNYSNDLFLLNDLKKDTISQLLDKRLSLPVTIKRSLDDYSILTSIPNLNIFVREQNNDIKNFYIIGKGYDMQGVLYEYSSLINIEDVLHIKSVLNLSKIYILTPDHNFIINNLFNDQDKLNKYNINYSYTQQSMAWGKIITDNSSYDINNLYVWGMDSI